jgi:hypothetical protein
MTDQSPAAAFIASSLLNRANVDCVDQLATRHVSDSVDAGRPGHALLQAIKG